MPKTNSSVIKLPSGNNLPRVATLMPPIHSPMERPRVDLAKITADNLPRVAQLYVGPRLSPRKRDVDLMTISSENLPRVATLKKSGSVSSPSFGSRIGEPKLRERFNDASKPFVVEFEQWTQGQDSPGVGKYATITSTIGDPNQINTRIKQSKFFSISKAKRDTKWKTGEGADSGMYNISREINKTLSRRDGGKGAAWGKASRKII